MENQIIEFVKHFGLFIAAGSGMILLALVTTHFQLKRKK